MKIFADNGFEGLLMSMVAGIHDQEGSIVQLEQDKDGARLQDVVGLKIAIDAAKAGAPVVMLGWMPEHMYIERKAAEWFAAMGHPNVMLVRLPGSPEEVARAFHEAKTGSRPADPLAVALLNVHQTNRTVSVLHHDLYGAERDEARMARWLERAKAVFGDKPQDELIRLVKEGSSNSGSKGPLAGEVFPDVCVDVEGTLLTSDGQLRADVLALAEEKAKGGPITIWTGGDVYRLTQQLRAAGVKYKIASKDALRGAKVRVVIDDQPELAFKTSYGVDCDDYICVA